MKKHLTVLIAFCMFGFGTAVLQAQNLDRVAISSGGICSNTINATIGEIFVFSVSASGISLDAGSQSDEGNSGGLITSVSKTEITRSEILIYPNPVDDYLNLQINGLSSENVSFQVYDVAGKLIMQQNSVGTNNLHRIQVKQLPQGNYFVNGYTEKGEAINSIKFIKL
jgi:hypothetical protein